MPGALTPRHSTCRSEPPDDAGAGGQSLGPGAQQPALAQSQAAASRRHLQPGQAPAAADLAEAQDDSPRGPARREGDLTMAEVLHKLIAMPETLKEVVSGSARTLRHLISAQVVDRDGEVLTSKGCRPDLYLKSNPVVFFNHQARELPIARSLEVSPQAKTVEATTQFAGIDQLHEVAERTFRMYRDGFMNCWSVGFKALQETRDKLFPDQSGKTITEWELLEYSAVGIPSNPAAVTQIVKALRAKRFLRLPDGATERDLGEALGTLPLPKYWEVAGPMFYRDEAEAPATKKLPTPNTGESE